MSKITIDELKIFLGTGLKVNVNDPELSEYSFELSSIETWLSNEREPLCMVERNDNRSWSGLLSDIKPIVRPLSYFTPKRLEQLESEGLPHKIIQQIAILSIWKESIGNISLDAIQYLASKNYDIFNWLNKTGEDGQPLAIEKQ